MLTPTHIVWSQTALLVTCIATGHAPDPAEALIAAGAATLIPDLDKRASLPGRLLPPVADALEHHVGHRTLTHSLAAQAVVGLIAKHLLPYGVFLALVSGWVSHSVADMMTPSGVCWFFPSRVRCVLPGNHRLRIEAMSPRELGFAIVAALLCFLLLPWALEGQGTTGLLRQAMGDIQAARTQYDARKGEAAWRLKVAGTDNRTFARIDGAYPVIGPWQGSGFLLAGPSGPVTICKQGCAWYAARAVLQRGAPEVTTTRTLNLPATTGRAIARALEPLQTAGTVYVSGSTKGDTETHPPTIVTGGGSVTLHYAAPDTIAKLGPLRDATLTVQVRHPPGGSVPDITAPVAHNTADDKALERWLTPGRLPAW